MSALRVRLVPCRSDNYAVLLHDEDSGETAVVDTPETEPIAAALEEEGWRLTHILNTHHHGDHVAGNRALKERHGATVYGSEYDAKKGRVPGLDVALKDGDGLRLGDHRFDVIAVPGHTLGHIAYYACDAKMLFAGDTLFSLGCGRLFEGDAEMMWHSLDLLRHLPDDTQLYCGHEYTLSNGEFALEVEPGNAALRERVEEVRELMRQRRPSIPVSIGREKATNPFLRPQSAEIRDRLGLEGVENWRVFAALRERKDAF
ncbi:MAG TPA: hydroxyacylglutathione hydrolase [Thermopetrobacter sp.]|nr:hydroxyacylglutathione hydrolase [Thermopetrobacter sp.]